MTVVLDIVQRWPELSAQLDATRGAIDRDEYLRRAGAAAQRHRKVATASH